MKLTDHHTRKIALFYAVVFLTTGLWYIYHQLTFTAIEPVFFAAKPDITGHIIFGTGIQHALIKNSWLQWLFDLLFFSLSALLVFCFIKKYKILPVVAWMTILFNTLYCYLFSCMSFVSIEPFITWIFFPFLFSHTSLKKFYFKFYILRILFILFFASAGIWKLRAGGAFHQEQFSGILLNQFASVLVSGENNWFIDIVKFLIDHPPVSFVLYWVVLLGELFFLVGLFTRRFDKILFWILVGFLFFDYFLMEINYFSWLPFALLFYFPSFEMPED